MVLVNVLISLIVRTFKKLALEKINFIPHKNYWLADEDKKEVLEKILLAWIYGYALIINFFIDLLVAKIWFVNRSIGGELWEYSVMFACFLLVFFVWAFGIKYRLGLQRDEYFVSKEYIKDEDD
jgi:hypothetical protein